MGLSSRLWPERAVGAPLGCVPSQAKPFLQPQETRDTASSSEALTMNLPPGPGCFPGTGASGADRAARGNPIRLSSRQKDTKPRPVGKAPLKF